ncbi:MAG: SUMF1/EgtB/PvdO family nonheme iron enzyme, partial [Planctomycetaceae bacterium]|nr:SUMF1/EgtB/PvdO family nonheme iron enzyme [Planctomycetaceae bacterium]
MRTLHYCALLLLLLALSLSAEARTWTAKTGETIDGEFVKLEDGNVLIQLPNGSRVSIKLDLLSDADQKFVNEEVNPFKPVNNPFVVVTPPEVRETFGLNTPRNVLEQEAQKGNPEALYYLAQCYGLGMNDCPQDEKKSAELLQRGSQLVETGNPFAQCCQAHCYLKGIGVPEDKAEAVKWFRKAAEQGNAAGQGCLGVYYRGEGDEEEAVKWLRKAAEQGDAFAQFFFGECYTNGSGVPKDMTEAAKWFLKSAEQGFVPSQFMIGVLYAHGEGVPEDKGEAVKWYRKAAEQGYEEAIAIIKTFDEGGELVDPVKLFQRAMAYLNGEDVPEDIVKAAQYFLQSAELGLAPAQFMIGICYENGEGVPQDLEEAVKWFRKSAEQGFPAAQHQLGACYLIGNGVVEDDGEAIKWYRKAAEQGHAESQFELGLGYYFGRGVPEDKGEAVKWFRKAGEQGWQSAQYWLGECYRHGTGVAQDNEEAVKWYRKAAEQGNRSAREMLQELESKDDDDSDLLEQLRRANEEVRANIAETVRRMDDKAAGHVYKDNEYGFSFSYPENWRVHPDPASINMHAALFGEPDDGFPPGISIQILPPIEDIFTTTKEKVQREVEESGGQNVRIFDFGHKQLGGRECLFIHIQMTLGEGTAKGLQLEQFQFMLPHKGKTLQVMLTDSPANFGKNRPIFDSIANSFQFDDVQNDPAQQETKEDKEAMATLRNAGERMTLIINGIEYAFRWCPPGTFMMGSPKNEEGRKDDETQHQVTLTKGLWMLETEVTQGMWESVMGNNPSKVKGIKLPVEMVSWDDCQEYIMKLNGLGIAPAGFKFALPTEAQ